jgi:hypothetical protein
MAISVLVLQRGGKILPGRTVLGTLIGKFPVPREEEVVEDQDRTPEEEADAVEAHAHDPGALEPGALLAKDDDDVEAHALRDPGAMDPGAMRSDDEDEDPGAI